MVQVIGKSEEELRNEQRFSKLVEIAQNNFTPARVSVIGGIIFIEDEDRSSKDYITVRHDINKVTVKRKESYDLAFALAQTYEGVNLGETWFLKKDYVD